MCAVLKASVKKYPERIPVRTPQKIVLFLLKPKSRCPKTADANPPVRPANTPSFLASRVTISIALGGKPGVVGSVLA